MRVCHFDGRVHMDSIRDCVIELQDFERRIDPRLPRGIDIVDDYISEMLDRCAKCEGRVLVAEVDGEVIGYASVMAKVSSDEIEDGDLVYGLVSDLIILEGHQRKGFGRQLLEAAEMYARSRDVKTLRIGVLSSNKPALDLYVSQGFSNLYVELEMDLSHHNSD